MWSNDSGRDYKKLQLEGGLEAEELMSYKIDYFLSNPLHVIQICTKALNKTPPPATSGLEVDTAFLLLINTQHSHAALATQILWRTSPRTLLFSSTALKLEIFH